MTTLRRTDVTSAEARAIHKAAQRLAETGEGPPHDEVACWCCCFQCGFNFPAVMANDRAIGVDSVF